MSTYTDSDWAGCRRTRRSTSGGCIMLGSHMIQMWSKTQATVALSSAEAELYGTVKASSESMGVISLLKDFGKIMINHVYGDASAALAIIGRSGVGRVRHLDTSYLWIQEKSANDEIKYNKVCGTENIADLFTKALDWGTLQYHTEALGGKVTAGRDEMGYQVAAVQRQDLCGFKVPGLHRDDKIWTRMDLGAQTTKTTMRGGPPWAQVTRRLTLSLSTGQILKDEAAGRITRAIEHERIKNGPIDIMTILVYK